MLLDPSQATETSQLVNNWGSLGLGGIALLAAVRLISKISIFLNGATKFQEKVEVLMTKQSKHIEAVQEHNKEMSEHAKRIELAISSVGLPTRLPHDPTPIQAVRVHSDSEASGPPPR